MFKITFKIRKLTHKERLQKKARRLVQKMMEESYRHGTQSLHIEAIMGGIKDELQEQYREDNIPTTVCLMLSCLLRSCGLDNDDEVYKKVADIVYSD
jgi:hypothetical protein